MKRPHAIFLGVVACVVLLAGIILHRSQAIVPVSGDSSQAAATSSGNPVTSVSADALAPQGGASTTTATAPSFGDSLKVKAAAAEDLATGVVLYGFHPDLRWPVASITKLMSAEIILDHMNLGQTITLATPDFAGGSSSLTASLQPGDEYLANDLLKVMLVPSSNEAAEAFARTYGRDRFIAAMNAQAAAWNLGSTHFDDPSGLSAANQSTPREFLDLVRHVYIAHPEIFAITQSRTATVQDLANGAFKQFATTNDFAGRAGFIGGKTGTTPEAGDNLVSIFQVNGDPVAILVFGAADRYAASESLLQWLETNSRS
jgi:D-alanyl-D-alanine carboxypeptidase